MDTLHNLTCPLEQLLLLGTTPSSIYERGNQVFKDLVSSRLCLWSPWCVWPDLWHPLPSIPWPLPPVWDASVANVYYQKQCWGSFFPYLAFPFLDFLSLLLMCVQSLTKCLLTFLSSQFLLLRDNYFQVDRVPVTPYLSPYFWRPWLACWLFHANFCVTYCICHCGGGVLALFHTQNSLSLGVFLLHSFQPCYNTISGYINFHCSYDYVNTSHN